MNPKKKKPSFPNYKNILFIDFDKNISLKKLLEMIFFRMSQRLMDCRRRSKNFRSISYFIAQRHMISEYFHSSNKSYHKQERILRCSHNINKIQGFKSGERAGQAIDSPLCQSIFVVIIIQKLSRYD